MTITTHDDYAVCLIDKVFNSVQESKERAMTDTTYVQQLRQTISGQFYFGAMCRETKRRIAISPDASGGKQRYSQSGETIVSCNHCHKTHRFDNRDIFSFSQVGW
jgi:hypothetical protein